MDEQINVEPGVKGVITTAIAKTKCYSDWVLIISHVEREENADVIYCYACTCIPLSSKITDEAKKTPIRFGDVSHYNFYKPTEEEINMMKEFLKQKNLKFIKGINKMFDR